jgi:hypothetical protein
MELKMVIHHWENNIHNVEICCQSLWNWLANGVLYIESNADLEKCVVAIRWGEEKTQMESIFYCGFCGSKIEFIQE